MGEMNPADVSDELAQPAVARLRRWRTSIVDNEWFARYILAAVLPLHEQQVRAELAAATARAETAEAALAEMRERLDAVSLLLPVLAATVGEPRRDARSAELVAKALAVHMTPADISPHADLDRLAAEQGNEEGGDRD